MGWLWETEVETNDTNGSVKEIKHKVLKFSELWSNYPNKDDIDHKQDALDDYCAIKLSDTLLRAGIKMKSFKGARCWGTCTRDRKHAIRATELSNWLELIPFAGCPKPKEFTGKTYKNGISGKTGIVYFSNYWIDTGGGRTGDHIDLWDKFELAGSGTFSSIARTIAPNIVESISGNIADYFGDSGLRISSLEKSDKVLFWEIK